MELKTLLSDSAFLSIMGGIITFIGGCFATLIRWVTEKLDRHDERLMDLERNTVNQEEFDKALCDIYRKMDEGFRDINKRLDELMRLMIAQHRP